jgi:hypothetical protein
MVFPLPAPPIQWLAATRPISSPKHSPQLGNETSDGAGTTVAAPGPAKFHDKGTTMNNPAARDPRVDPQPGDVLLIDGEEIKVTAVGAVAFDVVSLDRSGAMTPAEWLAYAARATVLECSVQP